MDPTTRRPRPHPSPCPLLDEAMWEAPERLSLREGRDEAGDDWIGSRDDAGFDMRDGEDDR